MLGVRTLVLVEGESDAFAVRALLDRVGFDVTSNQVQVLSAGGITNFSKVVANFIRENPGGELCGLYDDADEWHVRRALVTASRRISAQESLEAAGFYACVADLEDELIRGLGVAVVEQVLEAQAELMSFRRFQAMPEHRSSAVGRQLHRFLGTRATRKIRLAQLLVERLDLDRLPSPFAGLVSRLIHVTLNAQRSDA